MLMHTRDGVQAAFDNDPRSPRLWSWRMAARSAPDLAFGGIGEDGISTLNMPTGIPLRYYLTADLLSGATAGCIWIRRQSPLERRRSPPRARMAGHHQ